MQDGFLPERLRAAPLRRISPSRFVAMQNCALREVWSASGNLGLLPQSPASYLGTIVHRLLEMAAKNQFLPPSLDKIEAEWDRQVAEIEESLSNNWITRINVPLRSHVYRYAVRRVRAIRRAFELAGEVSHLPMAAVPRDGLRAGTERWLESSDCSIGGFVDRILLNGERVTLRDYKTGHVFENDTDIVQEPYRIQLRLYAALFNETFGRWPDHLDISPPVGVPVEISFSAPECEALLSDASRLLQEVNSAVDSGQVDSLGSPSPATCRFCQFRPKCTAYWEARRSTEKELDWPHDLRGELIRSEVLGDGYVAVTIVIEDSHAPITVQRITPDPVRHPAAMIWEVGQRLALFNLRYSQRTLSYTESATTTIYVDGE